MTTFADVGKIIERNQNRFRKPGVLSVRPGYRIEGGWPAGDPRIVVIVADSKGDAAAHGIPAHINGIPVEVRTATPQERMRAYRPDTYAAVRERARPEHRAPEFPFEITLASAVEDKSTSLALRQRAAKPQVPYEPPAGVALNPVTGQFSIECSASPDAGWPSLKAFLGRTEHTLSVAMYDFTSAHILSAVETSLNGLKASPRSLSLVLDHPARNPSADQTDEETEQDLESSLKSLSFAWAPVRASPEAKEWIFPTAYHIKVAVRDAAEVWLSSGNWNNSNQPEDAPASEADRSRADAVFTKSDRDWHVVVASPALANLFNAFVLNDLESASGLQKGATTAASESTAAAMVDALAEQAADLAEENPAALARAPLAYFKPETFSGTMTLQPLLTPDSGPDGKAGIYVEKMRQLISSARNTLYIQLQYIHPSDKLADAGLTSLIDAVAERMAAGVDVRIILSQHQSTQWMELLRAVGIDTDRVRIQNGVHNKGFLVDHATVVISSQNWSGDGVLRNRDAGLIIDHAPIAQYFEQVFEQDWEHVAVSKSLQASLGVPVSVETTSAVRSSDLPRVLVASQAGSKVSPLVEVELQARGVTQAIVILERSTVAAASTSFIGQTKALEQHFVLDERSWSASVARSRSRVSAAAAQWSGRRPRVRSFHNLGIVLGDVHADGLAALRNHPAVRYIASSVSLSLIRPIRVSDSALSANTTWGIDMLEMSDLWAAGWTGRGVFVGHVDTGLDGTHPALQGAVHQFLMTDDEGFPVPNAPARDTDRHGTHTAGTIAGRPVGGRRVGVAPDAMLCSAAVIEGGNTVARILAGLDWVAGNGVKIVSMSLGVRGYRPDFLEIMRTLRDRGILAVVAAGNEGAGTSRSPGNYDVVLSIGACGPDRGVADFSSSESFSDPFPRQVPELIAPGVGVISAKVGGGFLSMDGTSMATPHIAGLAATLWEAQPTATVGQIQDAILQSCVLPAADPADRAGRGVPNGPRAYEVLTGQSLQSLPTHKVTVPVSSDVRRRVTKSVRNSLPQTKKPLVKTSRNGRHRASR